SLRGKTDSAGGVVFDLNVPRAAASAFVLAVPANREVQTDDSMSILEATKVGESVKYGLGPLVDRGRLRLVPKAVDGAIRNLAALRQDVDYEFSERGIDVTAQFRIDAA